MFSSFPLRTPPSSQVIAHGDAWPAWRLWLGHVRWTGFPSGRVPISPHPTPRLRDGSLCDGAGQKHQCRDRSAPARKISNEKSCPLEPFFSVFFSIKINQESQGRCQCVHLVWVWDPRGGTPTCVRPRRCGVLCFWAHRGSHVHRRLRVEIHCQRLTLSLLCENKRMLLAEESHCKFQAGLGVVYRHLKRTGERTSMRF